MDRDPQKFYVDDKKFHPRNFTPEDVERRKYNVPLEEKKPKPYKPTNVEFIDQTVHQLTKVMRYPLQSPNLYKRLRPVKGALLYGKPGTGKTIVASLLCDECDRKPKERIAFIEVRLPVVVDGNPSNNIAKYFDAGRAMKPSLLFIDEADALLAIPGLAELLQTLIDGVSGLDGVTVLAATNCPECISPALRRTGRLELSYEFKLPNYKERRRWLNFFTEGWTFEKGHMKVLASETEGFSAGDLGAICRNAQDIAYERLNPGLANPDSSMWGGNLRNTVTVATEDLDMALNHFKDSHPRSVGFGDSLS